MILVVAEQKDGKLNRASWEAIAGAQQLVEAGAAGPITVAVPGSGVQAVAAELAAADVSGGAGRRFATRSPPTRRTRSCRRCGRSSTRRRRTTSCSRTRIRRATSRRRWPRRSIARSSPM